MRYSPTRRVDDVRVFARRTPHSPVWGSMVSRSEIRLTPEAFGNFMPWAAFDPAASDDEAASYRQRRAAESEIRREALV